MNVEDLIEELKRFPLTATVVVESSTAIEPIVECRYEKGEVAICISERRG